MNVGLSGNYFRNYNVQRKPEPKPDERKTVEKEMIQGAEGVRDENVDRVYKQFEG